MLRAIEPMPDFMSTARASWSVRLTTEIHSATIKMPMPLARIVSNYVGDSGFFAETDALIANALVSGGWEQGCEYTHPAESCLFLRTCYDTNRLILEVAIESRFGTFICNVKCTKNSQGDITRVVWYDGPSEDFINFPFKEPFGPLTILNDSRLFRQILL